MSRGGWRRRTIRPAPTPSDTPARAAPGRPLHPHRHICGVVLQLFRHELRGVVGVVVDAAVEPLAGDLGVSEEGQRAAWPH